MLRYICFHIKQIGMDSHPKQSEITWFWGERECHQAPHDCSAPAVYESLVSFNLHDDLGFKDGEREAQGGQTSPAGNEASPSSVHPQVCPHATSEIALETENSRCMRSKCPKPEQGSATDSCALGWDEMGCPSTPAFTGGFWNVCAR